MAGHRGQNAIGGTRKLVRHPTVNESTARYEAPPSTLALLRAIWAKREQLRPDLGGMIHGFLQRAREAPLTPKQLQTAIGIGRDLGIGYDDPAFEGPCRVEMWGPLPKKPPGRAA